MQNYIFLLSLSFFILLTVFQKCEFKASEDICEFEVYPLYYVNGSQIYYFDCSDPYYPKIYIMVKFDKMEKCPKSLQINEKEVMKNGKNGIIKEEKPEEKKEEVKEEKKEEVKDEKKEEVK